MYNPQAQLTEQEFGQRVILGDLDLQSQEKAFLQCGASEEDFLDHLNAKDPVNEASAVDILKVCQRYDATVTRRRVERFLILRTDIPVLRRWKIAKRFDLVLLKAICIIEGSKEQDQIAADCARLERLGLLPGIEEPIKKGKKKPPQEKPVEVPQLPQEEAEPKKEITKVTQVTNEPVQNEPFKGMTIAERLQLIVNSGNTEVWASS